MITAAGWRVPPEILWRPTLSGVNALRPDGAMIVIPSASAIVFRCVAGDLPLEPSEETPIDRLCSAVTTRLPDTPGDLRPWVEATIDALVELGVIAIAAQSGD